MSNIALDLKIIVNTVNINISRLLHLLKLYRLSKAELLLHVNKETKNKISEHDIFRSEIKLSYLKKIDTIFNKGLNYYLDPKVLDLSQEESIFFRKDKFNAPLNLGAKQIVNQFEQEKISLSVLSKLSDLHLDRILSVYSVNNNPQEVANEIRKQLFPTFSKNLKTFLRSLIHKFAEYNIFVFEFIETWNKKEKANLNGFYLAPNVIVLKRQQSSFRREIFTLIHELGHYLLNEEELDEATNEDSINYYSLNQIEKWCNDFAYYFLIGEYDKILSDLEQANDKNDYHQEKVELISENTNLSTIALYTRLLLNRKITSSNYNLVSAELHKAYRLKEEEKEKQRELEKEEGRKRHAAKPIQSPLFIKTIQVAYFDGIINESEFCRRLNIKANQLEKYIQ